MFSEPTKPTRPSTTRICGGSASSDASAFQRLDRQHRVPLDRRLVQFVDHVAIAGNAGRADVVEQQSHLDATTSDFGQCREEVSRRRIPAHDVELHVHVAFCGADLAGHCGDGLVIVAEQRRFVAANRRQPSSRRLSTTRVFSVDPAGTGSRSSVSTVSAALITSPAAACRDGGPDQRRDYRSTGTLGGQRSEEQDEQQHARREGVLGKAYAATLRAKVEKIERHGHEGRIGCRHHGGNPAFRVAG